MTRKKNKFFTFIFSFIPGAGEMYMGFFKQGASIMLLAFGLIAITGVLEMGPLIAILPVLWFYSFFHVHALASASDEEFYSIQDHYLFNIKDEEINGIFHSQKSQKILAVILIIIGVSSLWDLFGNMLGNVIPNFYDSGIQYVFDSIPRLVIGVLIIAAGVYLIKGKKQALDQEENAENTYAGRSYIVEQPIVVEPVNEKPAEEEAHE